MPIIRTLKELRNIDCTNKKIILSEGDSWFAYFGFSICHQRENIISILKENPNLLIYDLSSNGDIILNMLKDDNINYICEVIEQIKGITNRDVDYVLLSGGGNDIIGEALDDYRLNRYINAYQAGFAASQCINYNTLNTLIAQIKGKLLKFIFEIEQRTQNTKILMHTYDYAIPDGRSWQDALNIIWPKIPGPWIKPALDSKGITNFDIGKEIVAILLETYRDELRQVETIKAGRYVLVDTLGTLNHPPTSDYKEFWENELHPNEEGFKLIAQKIFEAIF